MSANHNHNPEPVKLEPQEPLWRWLTRGYFTLGFGEQAAAVILGLGSLVWGGTKGFDWLNLAGSAVAMTLWGLIAVYLHPRDGA